MDFVKLDIPAAGTAKRDCELTDFKLFPILSIEFIKDSDQTKWRVSFNDHISIKITSEEFIVHLSGIGLPVEGAFFIQTNSPWISELSRTNHPFLKFAKHYILFFYDEVIEVIASDPKYELIQ